MQTNYEAALARVLVHEGGYSNHPKDPGGATMKGITQRVYDAYQARRGRAKQPVVEIMPGEVQEIYRQQYADRIRFDELPAGVDLVVFDGAVNSGPAQAVKWLQRALGVEADGVLGNVTLATLNDVVDTEALITDICEQRMAFLKRLKTWKTFGRGWTIRVNDIQAAALDMAVGRTAIITPPVAPTPKARPTDVDKPSAPVAGPTIGAAGGAIAVTLNELRDQLVPLGGDGGAVDHIILYVTIAAAAVAVAGTVYGIYAGWKRRGLAASEAA